MSGWAGFTDEDLKRVRKLKVEKSDEDNSSKNFRESPPRVASFGKRPGNRASHTATSHSQYGQNRQSVSTSPTSTVTSSASRLGTGNKIPRVQTETADTTRDDLLDTRKEIEELETNEAIRREMGNLDKFREQQKVMEEVNKQRKALLSKTLSERQKKAQEEARKLAHIQRELMILDNLLTADVNVIRSRIEIASREFLDAQKRYERAEKEFVDAKVDLQKKSEQKESLTEHLYTIIHQNELRKSNKLSELMKELEMEQNNESQVLPTLPPLSSFNTMSSGDTIHSPKSPPHSTTTTNQPSENVNQDQVGSTNLSSQNVNLSAATENVNTLKDVKEGENVQSSHENLEQNFQSDKKTVDVLINNEKVNERQTAQCLPTNELSEKEHEKDKSAILTTNEKIQSIDTTINLTDSSEDSGKNTAQNLISISPINIGGVTDSQNSEDLPGTWSLDVVQKDNGH
ncbi:RAB6-interacting golgin-like isoform X2 [Mytilus californianus]|uniref:RAB6-interacting golgin-like isoform X2 n=1 Tax=Mytilus californianus TaxID=6549 RepID=UPI002245BFB9|nr:RAB6-interacting golgin-like isoform X2 [Mytilus californianus]